MGRVGEKVIGVHAVASNLNMASPLDILKRRAYR